VPGSSKRPGGPRANRATPYGELVAAPDRGLFWGNRGRLLGDDGTVARYSTTRAWLICLLDFKGRRRQIWTPRRLTELFFLDEATGLAAGHRPCGECRRAALRAFQAAWTTAFPGEATAAAAVDARLHADRLLRPRVRRTYQARWAELPPGAMVDVAGSPHLVTARGVLRWTLAGYQAASLRLPAGPVTVITPRCTVAVLAAGYRAGLHPSAEE
jgi:hypothetical protein